MLYLVCAGYGEEFGGLAFDSNPQQIIPIPARHHKLFIASFNSESQIIIAVLPPVDLARTTASTRARDRTPVDHAVLKSSIKPKFESQLEIASDHQDEVIEQPPTEEGASGRP